MNKLLIKLEAFITEYPILTFFGILAFTLLVGNAGQF